MFHCSMKISKNHHEPFSIPKKLKCINIYRLNATKLYKYTFFMEHLVNKCLQSQCRNAFEVFHRYEISWNIHGAFMEQNALKVNIGTLLRCSMSMEHSWNIHGTYEKRKNNRETT